MKFSTVLILVAVALVLVATCTAAEKTMVTKRRQTFSFKVLKEKGGTCEILHRGFGQVNRLLKDENDILVTRRAQSTLEHQPLTELGEIIEVFGHPQMAMNFLKFEERCIFVEHDLIPSGSDDVADEILPLIYTGDPSNRIDVVFMGDGYTANQRDLHFQDLQRLTDDMWQSDTFSSYLPLFNVWGVFRASAQSGIGYYSTPLNTAFGLYRDGTELRGVYCSKPVAAREACRQTGTDACDFPSLIGNDPYYGGLGGEFTISTSSETSGTKVLRHEFGHNFGDVGEEYDGGSVYSGANSQRSYSNLKWKHWFTNPNYNTFEDNDLLAQDYAWYDLANGPYTITFSSTGTYNRWFLRFSVSGCETPGSLRVTLDGVPLAWNSSLLIDRSFYEYFGNSGFSAGTHRLVFESTSPPVSMIRQLCSVSLLEYKNETQYHFDNDFIGAYPTYMIGNILAGYRPNNERCLMRNMTSTAFCVVCQENNWLQFLSRMTLLDGVSVETSGTNVIVTAEAVPLAQLREGGSFPNENYVITWARNGVIRSDLTGRFSFTEARSSAQGTWTVSLRYETTEVRSDPDELLTAVETFTI